jgi:5'-nucleotidase
VSKVLVTNDDGIGAAGLRRLVEALEPMAEVYVAAPMVQHSAKSQSITFLHELDISEQRIQGTKAAWAVHGTPTDCVKIGLLKMNEMGVRPDHIISGINMGFNTGLAVYYSGTVAAAREGALNGIHSIALSVGSHEASKFCYTLNNLPYILELSSKTPEGCFLNVNAPDTLAANMKGIKIVPTAPFGYGLLFNFSPAGNGNYQLIAEPTYTGNESLYDMDWVAQGYMTLSPVPTAIDDSEALSQLKAVAEDSEK